MMQETEDERIQRLSGKISFEKERIMETMRRKMKMNVP